MKGLKETFKGDRYVYYLDRDDGFAGVCIYPTHQIVYIKYVQLFVYIKYTSINLF